MGERAFVDFCAGLCLDQLWLMHVPVFFRDVVIISDPGWHVALWNLPERQLRADGSGWRVSGPTGSDQPLLFANFKGLHRPDEGYFPHQNRLRLNSRPDSTALLAAYRRALLSHSHPTLTGTRPAYGWRRAAVQSLRAVVGFVNRVPLPAIR